MSCLWMSLSLLFVLQHSVSSDEGAKLLCLQTVEVRPGDSTITCSIQTTDSRCEGTTFTWSVSDQSDSNQVNLCENDNNYICQWDNRTYVSLTIQQVTTDENVTVEIHLSCGMDTAEIQVKIQHETGATASPGKIKKLSDPGKETIVKPVMISVFSVITIVGILFFLYRTKKFSKTASHQAVNQEENSSSSEV